MTFVDEAKIKVLAGAGGDGSAAFLRQPFSPKGGPDGGDGGGGGSVILRADRSVATLLDLRDHPHVKAERGAHGMGKRRDGAKGRDRVVLVPVGTVVFEEDGTMLADIAREGDEVVIARGGRGGRGNVHFVSATRRAPSYAEKGEPGEERTLRLELRLLADIGLVGFPNAGKSTLISRLSAARPKIADYPFTTLVPNLGVVKEGDASYVIADIPGLVPGAHQGKGLGHRFLRHVRRAGVLVYLVDLAAVDRRPADDVDVLEKELREFDPDLAERDAILVGNKIDAAPDEGRAFRERFPEALVVSAVTGENLEALRRKLLERVRAMKLEAPERSSYVRHTVRDEPIVVTREDSGWRVKGARAERAVAMTDLDNDEAVERLQRRLIAMGVETALAEAGAHWGDEVRIGGASFDFEPEGGHEPA